MKNAFGIGLRACHYEELCQRELVVDFLEILTENYFVEGGQPLYYLDALSARYPMVMHGVSLGIGNTAPIDKDYVNRVIALGKRCRTMWISDHLCWTGIHGINTHDLLPLPLNEAVLEHVIERVNFVQSLIEKPLVIENPSTYVAFADDTLPEWRFLKILTEETNCRLLLDINNLYVNAHNHSFSPYEYIDGLPTHSIQQFHLAGHTRTDTLLIDTHDGCVSPEVLSLYAYARKRLGRQPTLIEWDAKIPPLDILLDEINKVKAAIYEDTLYNTA